MLERFFFEARRRSRDPWVGLVAALSDLPHVEVLVSSSGDDTTGLYIAYPTGRA